MPDLTKVKSSSVAKSSFHSKTDRWKSKSSYLNNINNPGPQDYDADKAEPNYIIKGSVDNKFGSNAVRKSMLNVDLSKSPYKDPSNA